MVQGPGNHCDLDIWKMGGVRADTCTGEKTGKLFRRLVSGFPFPRPLPGAVWLGCPTSQQALMRTWDAPSACLALSAPDCGVSDGYSRGSPSPCTSPSLSLPMTSGALLPLQPLPASHCHSTPRTPLHPLVVPEPLKHTASMGTSWAGGQVDPCEPSPLPPLGPFTGHSHPGNMFPTQPKRGGRGEMSLT